MTATTTTPAQLDGYTLEQRRNPLARRGCWYVRHDETGFLIGWIGQVNSHESASEGDGWSALSFAHRDALHTAGTPHDPDWFTGRIVWGDENRSAQDALEALVAATGDLWLVERAAAPVRQAPVDPTAGARKFAAQGFHDGLNRLHGR